MSLPVRIQALHLRRAGFTLGPLAIEVAASTRLAIVGPSGSGKTTLLRCIAGFERVDGGDIRIGEQLVAGDRVHLDPALRGVGMVFQDGALWTHMTSLQHLTFAAPGLGKAQALALLERAGLGAQAHKKPPRMSGGEAQRLGLVRALAPSPGVLLLDEPLRSVDVHQRDSLVTLVRELTEERRTTTILVTHDRDEALALADELVVLCAGKLVEHGPAAELVQRPRTAFTAAFLLGAACLPARREGQTVVTPFGTFAPPAESGDLRHVLLPGDVRVAADASAPAVATAKLIAATPDATGFHLRLALGDQVVHCRHDRALPSGSMVRLVLNGNVRLLPWQAPAALT